jgi:hypothetical protein
MKTSKTYMVAWDEMLDNALDVSSQLSSEGVPFLIWDVCTSPTPRPSWVAAEKVRYYGHFYNSLVDFAATDHDVFIFNAGDAFSDKHVEFIRIIEQMMDNDEDVWVMGPRMTNDGGDGIVTLIQMSKKYEDIGLISHLNGIYVSLRRELALFVLDYYKWLLKNKHMNFEEMVTGHCLDTVYAAWTLYNNKKMYRDWSFTMVTGTTTSYPTKNSYKECMHVKNQFKQYVSSLGGNSDVIQRIYDAIQANDSVYRSQLFPILDAYPLLNREEELDY